MKQRFKKLTVIIMCLLMIVSVISCGGKKVEKDYSDVVVDEPLMLDPAKASLNGISLGMTAEEVMDSGIFSEGSLTHHKKGIINPTMTTEMWSGKLPKNYFMMIQALQT